MGYYVELANTGKRTKVSAFVYQQLINAYGYYHIIRTPNLEVIRCKG